MSRMVLRKNSAGVVIPSSVTLVGTPTTQMNSTIATGAKTITWTESVTAPNSNTMVLVGCVIGSSTTSTTAQTWTFTYGGVAMTAINSGGSGATTVGGGYLALYYLMNPPSGAQTVSAGVASTTLSKNVMVGSSHVFTGVNSTTPVTLLNTLYTSTTVAASARFDYSVAAANSVVNSTIFELAADSNPLDTLSGTQVHFDGVNATGTGDYSTGLTQAGTGSALTIGGRNGQTFAAYHRRIVVLINHV